MTRRCAAVLALVIAALTLTGGAVAERPLEDVERRLSDHGLRKRGSVYWDSPCCGGKGKLWVRERADGKVRIDCFKGCPLDEILTPIGLGARDLYPRAQRRRQGKASPDALELRANRAHRALKADTPRLRAVCRELHWSPEGIDTYGFGLAGERLTCLERDGQLRPRGLVGYLPPSARRSGARKTYAQGGRGLLLPRGSRVDEAAVLVEGPALAPTIYRLGWSGVSYPSIGGVRPGHVFAFAESAELYIAHDLSDLAREKAEDMARLLARRVARVALIDLDPARDDGADIGDLVREDGARRAKAILRRAIGAAKPVPRPSRGRPPKQRAKAELALRRALADGDWHPSSEIDSMRRGAGVKDDAYKAARSSLKVETRATRVDGRTTWWMRLPTAVDRRTV